jgi:hypothetical protein
MKPIVTKEASTFYTMMCLLKICNKYADFLKESGAVSFNLKDDLNRLQSRIKDLEFKCNDVLDTKDAKIWQAEWTDKDFECYSSMLFMLADMNNEQRLVTEEFMTELSKGTIKAELA